MSENTSLPTLYADAMERAGWLQDNVGALLRAAHRTGKAAACRDQARVLRAQADLLDEEAAKLEAMG